MSVVDVIEYDPHAYRRRDHRRARAADRPDSCGMSATWTDGCAAICKALLRQHVA